jgi:methionyl-tRNA synthetase
VVENANAYVNKTAPWTLANNGHSAALAEVLSELYGTLNHVGQALVPFLPDTAERLLQALYFSAQIQLFPKFRP